MLSGGEFGERNVIFLVNGFRLVRPSFSRFAQAQRRCSVSASAKAIPAGAASARHADATATRFH